jgi:hypothetical protein
LGGSPAPRITVLCKEYQNIHRFFSLPLAESSCSCGDRGASTIRTESIPIRLADLFPSRFHGFTSLPQRPQQVLTIFKITMIRTATFALVLALVASCGSAFNTSPAFHKVSFRFDALER